MNQHKTVAMYSDIDTFNITAKNQQGITRNTTL